MYLPWIMETANQENHKHPAKKFFNQDSFDLFLNTATTLQQNTGYRKITDINDTYL